MGRERGKRGKREKDRADEPRMARITRMNRESVLFKSVLSAQSVVPIWSRCQFRAGTDSFGVWTEHMGNRCSDTWVTGLLSGGRAAGASGRSIIGATITSFPMSPQCPVNAMLRMLAAMLLLVFVGCGRDPASFTGATRHRMRDYDTLLTALRDRGCDLAAIQTIDELFDAGCRANVMMDVERDLMRRDAWGTPFVWRVCKASTGDVAVAVISCGQNRGYDWGNVDDLVYEVQIPASQERP